MTGTALVEAPDMNGGGIHSPFLFYYCVTRGPWDRADIACTTHHRAENSSSDTIP